MIINVTDFIGLPDRIIIKKINILEQELEMGTKTIQELREELSKFHSMAVNQDVKKAILMEYDGFEMNATKNVT